MDLGIFTPLPSLINFYGGGEIFIKEVLTRLNNKLNIIIIPTLNSIRNLFTKTNNEEICSKMSSIPFNFPQIIYKLCENNTTIEPEKIVYAYKDELKDVKVFYDINAFDNVIFIQPNWKIKLFLHFLRWNFEKYNYIFFSDSYYYSSKLQKPTMLTIHADIRPYSASIKAMPYLMRIGEDPFNFIKRRLQIYTLFNANRIFKSPYIKIITTVSRGEAKVWKVPKEKLRVLYPSNAFNKEILKYRTKNKENYIVFWARLTPHKGVLDIPFILKELKKSYRENIKIYIFGKFYDDSDKKFFSLIEKFNLKENIKYLGFLSDEEKYKVVSKAKALLYPSHMDNFSQVILESLALGTPVAAYNVEGPSSVYSGFRAVKFAKEFNFREMAKNTLEFLKMEDENYFSIINEPKLMRFLEDHSDWDKVAESVLEKLNMLL